MMNIQKAVIARDKMCETDLDRVTILVTYDVLLWMAKFLLLGTNVFFVVFVEGQIHEFKYRWNKHGLFKLWRKYFSH